MSLQTKDTFIIWLDEMEKGNPCWAYACYGRKIEKAMELRKKGAQILIVHEADFLDITQ